MALEPLTPEQRSAALEKAFQARQARAQVKADLKAGKTTLKSVLMNAAEDEAVSKMKVVDLLKSIPGVGERRAQGTMEEIGIAASRRIKGLGVHQKAALLEKFDNV